MYLHVHKKLKIGSKVNSAVQSSPAVKSGSPVQQKGTHMQPSCRFVYPSRAVEVGYVHRRLSNTMSTCTIWTCLITSSQCMMHAARRALAKAACFDVLVLEISLESPSIYLVVQMDLSRWKVVRCGKLALHWTLDCWQRPSRWANQAITRQQHIDSKIYKMEIEDIVALDLWWSF